MRLQRTLWLSNPESVAIEGITSDPEIRLLTSDLDMSDYGWMRLHEITIDLGPTAREDCTVAALGKLDKEEAEVRHKSAIKLKQIEEQRQSLLCLTAPVV